MLYSSTGWQSEISDIFGIHTALVYDRFECFALREGSTSSSSPPGLNPLKKGLVEEYGNSGAPMAYQDVVAVRVSLDLEDYLAVLSSV